VSTLTTEPHLLLINLNYSKNADLEVWKAEDMATKDKAVILFISAKYLALLRT